jgi:hypothetical protein
MKKDVHFLKQINCLGELFIKLDAQFVPLLLLSGLLERFFYACFSELASRDVTVFLPVCGNY